MKRLSVKLRVTLWYALSMALLSAIVLCIMSSVNREMLERELTGRLTKTVTEASHFIQGRNGEIRLKDFRFFNDGVSMALYDDEGALIAGQELFPSTAFPLSEERVYRLTESGDEYYIYDFKLPLRSGDKLWIRGATSMAAEAYAMHRAQRTNFILAIIMIFLASIGGFFILHQAFLPVKAIRETAEDISESNDLSRRINLAKGRDEISALAETFDAMLEKIEQAFEREKQFTSDASHELRTPVAVILSECEFLQEDHVSAEDMAESVEAIRRQAEKMSKLISELLTISRMDKHTLKVQFEATDVSELLNFVCDEQEEIQRKTIHLHRHIEPGIEALADRFLLARLFINLLANAYQYSHESGHIYVTLKKEGDRLLFSVKDEGIGIPNESLDKIWERFYQVDPARTNNGSMGLGLSMVAWIAECHEGHITVNSEEGKGSTFTFTMKTFTK